MNSFLTITSQWRVIRSRSCSSLLIVVSYLYLIVPPTKKDDNVSPLFELSSTADIHTDLIEGINHPRPPGFPGSHRQ
jgi:hypothetical protein